MIERQDPNIIVSLVGLHLLILFFLIFLLLHLFLLLLLAVLVPLLLEGTRSVKNNQETYREQTDTQRKQTQSPLYRYPNVTVGESMASTDRQKI